MDLLRRDGDEFRSALACLSASDAAALESRLTTQSLARVDPLPEQGGRDVLDLAAVRPPFSYLLDSYRQGAQLLDDLLRWILGCGTVRTLSAYGMQTRNLDRSDDEVSAFLKAEKECATRWAGDRELLSRCSFRFVGDEGSLVRHQNRAALRDPIGAYLAAARRLEARSHGADLQVNILAPYDPEWEINQAVVGGRFERGSLLVSDPVDFVVRSGSAGRSLASGALPLQIAHSQFALIPAYFPDCTVDDFRAALALYHPHPVDHGL